MKEVICINIGQAGVHIGNTFWEQIALEHDIQPDGTRPNTDDNDNISSFFSENESGKLIPRCISVDLDSDTIHGVKKSPYRELFQPDSFIYGKDGGCLYSKANNEREGKEVQQRLFSKIKALTESCEGLEGFMIFHSISGGTGSGLGSAIARHLDETYKKSTKIDLVLYPSPKLSNSVVEPYNTVLAHKDLEWNDLNLIFDNEALYHIIEQKLRISEPSYLNINRLIAQVASSLTANIRFNGLTNNSLGEIAQNIVPYPKIPFALPSYSPLIGVQKLFHEHPSVSGITEALFDPTNIMAKCDYTQNKVISCCIMFRGDALLYDINAAINSIKTQRELKFVDYIHTGIKTSLINEPPVASTDGDLVEVMRTGMMLMNSGAIDIYFKEIRRKFQKLYEKKAFLHWYDSMIQSQFYEGSENLTALMHDYEEICQETPPRPPNYDSEDDEDY